ncbi:MAG: response regulator, partial [Microcoleus sp. SIO2G3]|nr:response regulator [Microcoleus sp. SIO2G3]
ISAENTTIDATYARMNLDVQMGSYVVITIADTGTGIAPELLERIFEPFFTTKEIGKGTGLGLSTAIGIIKSHGGFVNVDSKAGKGTQFKLYLPTIEGLENHPTENLELAKGQGELVLIVDDEVAVRDITSASLQDYNYRTLVAADGLAAIALFAEHKHEISVVLMDIMMPSMDGLTAIRILQAMQPQVKIIATSGLPANSKLAEEAGASVKTFLAKPYRINDLLNRLHEVLTSSDQELHPLNPAQSTLSKDYAL